jgi:iron complex outermembrane receptor protein
MQFTKCAAALAATAALSLAAPAHAEGERKHKDPLAPRRVATGDTAALLSDEPGVSLNTGGGVSSLPAIHGLADDRIRMLVDGMQITSACANHMNPALSYAAPQNVGTIGVLSGLTPVSMGGDSIAGTITVQSSAPQFAEPGKTRISGAVSGAYRSVNHGISRAAKVAVASDTVVLEYAAAEDKAASYKDGHGKPVRDTLYRSLDQQLTMAAKRGDDLLTVKVGNQYIPYQGFVNQYMDMVGNRGNSLNADYLAHFGWGKLDTRIYWQDAKHEMGFFTPEKIGTMPMNTHGKDLGYALKAELPLSYASTLRIGNEFHGFTLDDWWPPVPGSAMMAPNTYLNINHGTRDVYSLYGEVESKWGAAWDSVLGMRAEQVRMDTGNVQSYGCGMMCAADTSAAAAFNAASHVRRDNNIDLSAIARYEGDASSTFEFGYTRKTRSPNLYERYSWGRTQMAMNMTGWFGDANGYVGNLDLKPEVAHTLGATANWKGDDSALTVTAYHTRVHNYIGVSQLSTYVTGTSTFANLQFVNQEARLYGADVSGSTGVWDNNHGKGTLRAAAGWTRGALVNTGTSLYHIMPFHARLTLEQDVRNWTNALEFNYVSAKNAVDPLRNEPVTASYTLVNLRTAYETGHLRFDFAIENAFNKFYYLPLGGVDFAAWKADGKVGQIAPVAGMGRSINTGVTVKF